MEFNLKTLELLIEVTQVACSCTQDELGNVNKCLALLPPEGLTKHSLLQLQSNLLEKYNSYKKLGADLIQVLHMEKQKLSE